MIDRNVNNSNPLYLKKRVIVTSKEEEESKLSIDVSQINAVNEEKNCIVVDSESPLQELPMRKEISQYKIDQTLCSYGSSNNFRMMIQSLLTKRSKIPFIKGHFKPEVYEKDFFYYYNQHRLAIMLRRGARKKAYYPKSAKNMSHCTINFQSPIHLMESPIEKMNSYGTGMQRSATSYKVGEPNSRFLTKIPNKVQEGECKRLDFAYVKAKDAARVVRRLEYSYNMKMNCMYNKPIHKTSAKIIQEWWRKMQLDRFRTPFVMRIQKMLRGKQSRVAFSETYYFFKCLPILLAIHDRASQNLNKIGFEELLFRYGLKTINRLVIPKANLLIRRIRSFLLNRKPIIPKIYLLQCSFAKFVFDWKSLRKMHTIQGRIKIFLMKHCDKIMLTQARLVHPYIYYYLKYGTKRYKKKIVEFRRCYRTLREFNLKVNKGIDNRFELLSYLMRKSYWKLFKDYNAESRKRDKFKPAKKRHLRKKLLKNDKENLQNAFEYWRIYKDVHKLYIQPHSNTRVKMIVQSLQSHKDMFSTLFFNQLKGKVENRPTKKEAMRRILVIKHDKTPSNQTYLNKYFQLWRNIVQKKLMLKSSRRVNRFLNDTKRKYKQSQAIKRFFLLNLIKTGVLYKGASLIQFIIKRNLNRHVYTKIRSITFKEHMENFLRLMNLGPKLRFLQWQFENKKYKHAMRDYILWNKAKVLGHKQDKKLKSICHNLSNRLQYHYLRRAFLRYWMNSGIYFRYPQCFNFQLLFINKKKKLLSKRRYRLMRYTINKVTSEQEDLRINTLLINKWDKWKKTLNQLRIQKALKERILKLSLKGIVIKKKALAVWRKINKVLSIKKNVLKLQKNYKTFINKKVKVVEKKKEAKKEALNKKYP